MLVKDGSTAGRSTGIPDDAPEMLLILSLSQVVAAGI